MSFNIRKLLRGKSRKPLRGAAPLLLSLFLSSCVTDGLTFGNAPKPTVTVAEVRTPGGKDMPDTPPLYCEIGKGSALFGREWYDFRDTLFELHKGQPANVSVARLRGSEQMSIQALFDNSGQKLIFCPFLKVAQGARISCTSLYTLEDDLQDGIRRTFDIPGAIRGGVITCAYSQQNLRPLTALTN